MPFDITTATPDISYSASGGQTVFSVPFSFFADADLVVTDNGAVKTLTTDYTVSGAGVTGGGSVTFVIGRAAGAAIRVRRSTTRSRTSLYTVGGAFGANAIEEDLDRLVCMIQEVESEAVLSYSVGTFTPTWTGFSTAPTAVLSYIKNSGLVTLFQSTGTSIGFSNGATMALSGLPAAIRPSAVRSVPCVIIDNHSGTPAAAMEVPGLAYVNTTGDIAFRTCTDVANGGSHVSFDTNGFNSTDIKGLTTGGWSITYPL